MLGVFGRRLTWQKRSSWCMPVVFDKAEAKSPSQKMELSSIKYFLKITQRSST